MDEKKQNNKRRLTVPGEPKRMGNPRREKAPNRPRGKKFSP